MECPGDVMALSILADNFRPRLRRSGDRGDGKEIRHAKVTIGSKADFIVKGESVKAIHATLQKMNDGRKWQIENHSLNKTFVNGMPVQTLVIEANSTFRFGDSEEIEFLLEKTTNTKDSKQSVESPNNNSLFQKYFKETRFKVFGALIALSWIGLIALMVSSLSTQTEDNDSVGYSWFSIEQAIDSTRSTLQSGDYKMGSGLTTNSGNGQQGVPFNAYIRAKSEGITGDSLNLLIEDVLDDANVRLSRAWNLEKQRRYTEAGLVYTGLIDRITDPRLAVTALAVNRQKWLSEQKID